MRPRTGAVLTIVAGLTGMALAVSAQRLRAEHAAAPTPGPPRTSAIDWAAARAASRQDAPRLLAGNRAAIAKISIPVLLPSDPDLSADLRIFGSGTSYSASSKVGDMSFILTGSARAFPVPARPARPLQIPADGILIGRSEVGLDASFMRFGATYSIEMECREGADRRCADEAYLRGVISRLAVLIPPGAP
jgi:hypothetical protein